MSREAQPLLLAGVFFLFAPVGVLVGLVQSVTEPAGWAFAMLLSVLSGLQAIAWAMVVRRGGWWYLLAPVLIAVPLFGFGPAFRWTHSAGYFTAGYGLAPATRQIFLLLMGCVELAAGFILTAAHIRRSERLAARAGAELEVAGRMHASLVPPIDTRAGGWRLRAVSRASSEMGGDIIDWIDRRDRGGASRVDVYLADVSGHGVGAGIVMAMLKSALRTRLLADPPLAELVSDVNRVLTDLTRPEMFATFAGLRLHPDGRAEYLLAGHLPILLGRAGCPSDGPGQVALVPNDHLPLGIVADEAYASGSVTLSEGDVMVIVTDGLTEVQDRDGQELGFEAIRKAVAALVARRAGVDEVVNAILATATAHGRQIDDQSVLAVQRGAPLTNIS